MDYDYQTFIKAGSCHSAPFLGMQAVLRPKQQARWRLQIRSFYKLPILHFPSSKQDDDPIPTDFLFLGPVEATPRP